MKKYFVPIFSEEFCYPKDTIIEKMKYEGLTEVKANLAEIHKSNDFFYCKEFGNIGEKGESCGKICDFYTPKNGKSGCCKHVGNLYIYGKEVTIKCKNQ